MHVDSLPIPGYPVNMRTDVYLTRDQVQARLVAAIRAAGGQAAWAAAAGISAAYVSDVLHGRRAPGSSIQRALGIERVELYQYKKGQQT